MAKLVLIVHGPFEETDRSIRERFLPAVKALPGLRTIDYASKPGSSAGAAPDAVVILTFDSIETLEAAVALTNVKRAIGLLPGAAASGGLTSLIYETRTMYASA